MVFRCINCSCLFCLTCRLLTRTWDTPGGGSGLRLSAAYSLVFFTRSWKPSSSQNSSNISYDVTSHLEKRDSASCTVKACCSGMKVWAISSINLFKAWELPTAFSTGLLSRCSSFFLCVTLFQGRDVAFLPTLWIAFLGQVWEVDRILSERDWSGFRVGLVAWLNWDSCLS